MDIWGKQITYWSVDSNARKLFSFPLDHRLTSASRASASLYNFNQRKRRLSTTKFKNVIYENFLMIMSIVYVSTFLSVCSFWALRSRCFFSARASAWNYDIKQYVLSRENSKYSII